MHYIWYNDKQKTRFVWAHERVSYKIKLPVYCLRYSSVNHCMKIDNITFTMCFVLCKHYFFFFFNKKSNSKSDFSSLVKFKKKWHFENFASFLAYFSRNYYVNLHKLLFGLNRVLYFTYNDANFLKISHQKNCKISKNKKKSFSHKSLIYE